MGNDKIIVYTDKDLSGKTFMGIAVETKDCLPDTFTERRSEIMADLTHYAGYLVDQTWVNKTSTSGEKLGYPKQSNKLCNVDLNIGHTETDLFFSTGFEYSDKDDLVEMRLTNIRGSELTEREELAFCQATSYRGITPYLHLADLLYYEGQDSLNFVITYNYRNDLNEGNVECDGVLVKAGELVDVYDKLLERHELEKFETIELYRLVGSEELQRTNSDEITNIFLSMSQQSSIFSK